MKYISVEYILKLHEKLISTTGGSDGVRDIELLKSSIENSKVTFDGEDYTNQLRKSALIYATA
ncbi:Fic family protein [Clostridium estertheticum]|uniref:Fic family protein n=1 Tax=Clostridium estertheticum TaxID=238834 RepID=UPI001CF2950A|nr:death on curing protein [Clostridium estertheticum]MCB2361060.1 death on curing protein [Clostridium estertheticum]